MGSSPTPGALVVDSYEHFINLKRQTKIDNLQNPDQSQYSSFNSREKMIKESITSICKYQKPYITKSLDSDASSGSSSTTMMEREIDISY